MRHGFYWLIAHADVSTSSDVAPAVKDMLN
jgi:hypothetical protein